MMLHLEPCPTRLLARLFDFLGARDSGRLGRRWASRLALATLFASGLSGPATPQACVGDTCDLGGSFRMEIGLNGLPIPVSATPARTGLVTQQPGAVVATSGATIMQQTVGIVGTPGTDPRSLMLAPGRLAFDAPPLQVALQPFGSTQFGALTNVSVSFPEATAGTVTFAAGGRTGPTTVTWCAGAPVPTASFNPGCLSPGDLGSGMPPLVHGLVRYSATRNQFGGRATGRFGGTWRRYLNVAGLSPGALPCPGGPTCVVGVVDSPPLADGVVGGAFGDLESRSAIVNAPGLFTASIGPSGTVLALGAPLTQAGGTIPFTGQSVTSVGVPHTTGMLTISLTAAAPGPQVLVRTGADGRNANGSGIVTLVSGAVSQRSLSGPSPVRGWLTLRIPEPGVLAGSTVALGLLAVLHRWIGRRRR